MKKNALIIFIWIVAGLFLWALLTFVPFLKTVQNPGLDAPIRSVRIPAHNIEFTVELAQSQEAQAKGLSNRGALPKGHGMLFVFSPKQPVEFWMNEMRFPLDILWISDGKVIRVEGSVPAPAEGEEPQRRSSPAPVDFVLEVNAGEAASIVPGDAVVITEPLKV